MMCAGRAGTHHPMFMMHIAINAMFRAQPTVGSGQYLHGLLHALPLVAPDLRLTLLLPAYMRGRRADKPEVGYRALTLTTPFDGRNEHLAKLWFEQVAVPLAATHVRADMLHVPYFAPALWSPVPQVATILDVIPLRLPEYRGRLAVRLYMRLVARAARGATQIIAISRHGAEEIARTLGCDPARVTIVPLAAGAQFHPRDRAEAQRIVAARYGIAGPFVYYVGGLDARKNVSMLVQAVTRLRRAGGPAVQLVIAGRALGADPRLFPDLDAAISTAGAGAFVTRIDVPREDGSLLYAAATAFAYPSRYEGFGLPPLEAMACGTPVIVADATSLPEVVGDAALRVPPDDIAGWSTALWRVLADDALRADLSRRGLERAAQFSDQRTARETLMVYAKAARRDG